MNLKFHMQHDQTPRLRSPVKNSRWPPILKIAKLIKSALLQNGLIYLAEMLYEVLVGP